MNENGLRISGLAEELAVSVNKSSRRPKPHGALHRIPQSRLRGHDGRPDMVAVGTIVWLASELMFFAALFAAYFTIRNVTNGQAAAAGTESLWQTSTEMLNVPFAVVNTTVLVASSFTCQMGVFAAGAGEQSRRASLARDARGEVREHALHLFSVGPRGFGGFLRAF